MSEGNDTKGNANGFPNFEPPATGSMTGPGDDEVPGPAQGIHGSSPQDVTEFLEHATQKGPIDTITIWQDGIDGRQKLRVIGVKSVDPIELSAMLSRLVHKWALARGRRTTFILQAHAGAEDRGSHPIIREVQPTLSTQASEPANETGLLAMLMRHNNDTMRTAHVVMDANAGHLTRQLRDATARIRQLESERDQVSLMMRDNILQSIDTEYRREQNRLKVHAQAQVLNVVIQNLPAIIQKFTANQIVEKFRQFAASLTPEQQFAIASALKKEQTEMLGGLFEALQPPKVPEEVAKALESGDQASAPKAGG